MKNKLAFLLILTFLGACRTPQKDASPVNVSNGTVERLENFDTEFVTPRNVDVWLPEGYNPEKKYAVLYMQDGQMLFDSTTTWNKQEWGVDETITRLTDQGKIKDCIVVGIWNGGKTRHPDYFPQKPFESLPQNIQDSLLDEARRRGEAKLFSTSVQSDNYLNFIVYELKNYIDYNYPTLRDRDNTYIMGSSMGGLISIYAICEFPDIFGGAACLSTHWTGTFTADNNPIPDAFVDYLAQNLPDPATHKIYFDYGTETLDSLYEPFQLRVDSVMKERGYSEENWMTRKFPGENHSENAWQKRLHIPLTFLLKDEAK
jgi:enterochelin esterase-like enzyme